MLRSSTQRCQGHREPLRRRILKHWWHRTLNQTALRQRTAFMFPFSPFHFCLDRSYRIRHNPTCVNSRSSGRQLPFFLPALLFSLLSPLECAVPRHGPFCTILVQISPLDSALTDRPLVSPLECALAETGGRGVAMTLVQGTFLIERDREHYLPLQALWQLGADPADGRQSGP